MKIVGTILSLVMLLMCNLTPLAAAPVVEQPLEVTTEDLRVNAFADIDLSHATPISADEVSTITPDVVDSSMQRNQIGEPMDEMFFYYMNLYPIIQDPSNGQLSVLDMPVGKTQNTRQTFFNSYTTSQTTALYNEVLKQGFNVAGWQVKIKFRFDFIMATSWTLSLDGRPSTTSSIPGPFNPYQTYIYTYNSFFKTDPMKVYNTTFEGSVNYMDKYDGNRGKNRDFNAITIFNTAN